MHRPTSYRYSSLGRFSFFRTGSPGRRCYPSSCVRPIWTSTAPTLWRCSPSPRRAICCEAQMAQVTSCSPSPSNAASLGLGGSKRRAWLRWIARGVESEEYVDCGSCLKGVLVKNVVACCSTKRPSALYCSYGSLKTKNCRNRFGKFLVNGECVMHVYKVVTRKVKVLNVRRRTH